VAIDQALELPWGINPGGGAQNYWGEWLGDYGSRLRDHALAYALLHRHQITHPKRENLMLDLASEFDKRSYYSTQERLALFLAARAAGGDTSAPWTATLQGGKSNEKISSSGSEQRSYDVAALRRGVSVTNQSAAVLFAEVAVEGYPIKPLVPRDDRISIERSWWSGEGAALATRQFKAGDTLLVRLRVSAKQRIKDALVVERIPAGMEVENLNLSQGARAADFSVDGVNIGAAQKDARIKYSEYRDDRFVAAVELSGQKIDLFYLLRVVTPGQYGVPAPFAEDMYRPELRGVGKPEPDITVVDPRAK
jgi:alpha-2-macroglobulin